ncbi:MAG: transglycosylase SLT domain-containing protein [Acinetobacter sp.]|nr:transglycosylase SLT domain-containing protein [Acinetobacter sp.]
MSNKNLKVALQITADLNQAKREVSTFRDEFQKTSQAADQATAAQTKTSASAGQAAAQMQKMSKVTDMHAGIGQLKDYDTQLHKVDQSLINIETSTNKVKTASETSLFTLNKLAAAIGIAASINLVDTIDQWGQYDVRIKMATESEAEYTLVKQRLLETANNTYRPLQEAQELYIRTSKSIKGLGYETQQTLDITDSFSYLLTTNAAAADKAQSALDAFSKSIINGKVSGNEWQSMMIAMPTLVDAISETTGIARSEVEQLGIKGEISLKQLTEAFRQTKDANQDLAATMDNTRKDAMQALQNNMTSLLGEFNKTYQVTQTLSAGIVLLAENVELIGGAAVTAGIALLTKYIISSAIAVGQKTTAVYAEVKATFDSIKAKQAESAQAVALAKQHHADAAARLQKMRVMYAENQQHYQLISAIRAEALAKQQLDRSNKIATVSTISLTSASRTLMTVLGGPIGLISLVAGATATFFLFKDSSDEVTPSLEDQTKTVAELAEEYRKLDETQQRIAVRDATKKIDELTAAHRKQYLALAGVVRVVMDNSEVSKKDKDVVKQLYDEYVRGEKTADQLATALNKLSTVNSELKKRVDDQAKSATEAKNALDRQNQIVDVYTGKAKAAGTETDSFNKHLQNTSADAKAAANDLNNLSKAFQDYMKNAQSNSLQSLYQQGFMDEGYTTEQAKALADAQTALNKDAKQTSTLTAEQKDQVLAHLSTAKQLNDLAEQLKKKDEETTKQREKQKKIAEQTAAINKKVLEQSKKYNYEGLEQQFGLPRGLLSAISMQESRGNKNARSPVGAMGAFQFMPATADRFGLKDRTDVEESAKAAAKYLSILLKMFEGNLDKAIMAYNAGEGNVLSGKAYGFKETQNYLPSVKRYLAGANNLDDENAQANLTKIEQAQQEQIKREQKIKDEQKSLQEKYYSEDQKRLVDHLKNREAILKGGFDREKELDLLLAEDKRFNQENDKPRIEALKRIQDSLPDLENDLLRATGQGLQADLNEVDQKYKQLKADIETLLQSTVDPADQFRLNDQLVKLNLVIDKEKLTLEFNDAMRQLDELQELRQQKQETLKLKFDSGQISQYQYRDGLDQVDADMLPRLQGLVDVARELAEQLNDAFAVEKLDSFSVGLKQVNTDSKKFLPTLEQIEERIASGMADAMMDWIDGTKSASDAFKDFASSFLREIAKMILQQIAFNTVKMISKALGGYADGGLVTGFSTGGWTGAGGKYQPAGVVHKDEFVIRKESTNQAGAKEFLSYFNRYGMDALNKFKGYADGGLVAAPNIQVPNIQAPQLNDNAAQIAQSTSFNANQNFYLVDDPKRILDTLNSSEGQENILVMMSRDPTKFKGALKIGG